MNETSKEMAPAIFAEHVEHRYRNRVALRDVSLSIPAGKIFALLGPNGSGKSTLFRLCSTIMPLQQGVLRVAGVDVGKPMDVRRRIGIVFQTASVDPKLSVDENLACQAALYGLHGKHQKERVAHVLQQVGLTERRGDRCETLSGGMRRRVELAKGLLHSPEVLLLDEPSTGLDPAARLDLWHALELLRARGTSVVLTTHLLEEADKADQIALLDQGQVIATGSPDQLRAEMGEGLLTVTGEDLNELQVRLRDGLGIEPQLVQNQLRIHCSDPAELVPQVARLAGDDARSITIGRPGLEDVFIAKTGHRFFGAAREPDTETVKA